MLSGTRLEIGCASRANKALERYCSYLGGASLALSCVLAGPEWAPCRAAQLIVSLQHGHVLPVLPEVTEMESALLLGH
jgi:hypothetical protein